MTNLCWHCAPCHPATRLVAEIIQERVIDNAFEAGKHFVAFGVRVNAV